MHTRKMTVQVGTLFRKRTIRKLNGQLVELVDEANGGAIVKNGQVVNPERYAEIQKQEEDAKLAAQALLHATAVPEEIQAVRTGRPTKETVEKVTAAQQPKEDKFAELEAKVKSQDEKLDAILAALNK